MGSTRDTGDARSRWSAYAGHLPTSTRGTEHAIALLLIGVRLGTVAQMVPGFAQGVSLSPRPALYAACWGLAVCCSVAVSIVVFRRGAPPSAGVFAVDMTIALGLMLVGSLAVPPPYLVGSWVAPFPGHLLSVAVTGATVVMSRWAWSGWLFAAATAAVAFAVPAWDSTTATTIIGNTLTLVIITSVGRWILGYLRRVAADGDQARAEALELGRREEERRAQLAIHNGAAVIRMLGDPTLDPETRHFLQKEAQRESARMRSYLQGRGTREQEVTARDLVALPDLVTATCDRFLDLPLQPNVDLAAGAYLDADSATALDLALASLLLNVRDHAEAETVVVHADAPPGPAQTPSSWIVTLHDDGVGFEVSETSLGVGLREVVVDEMHRHGVDVTISSMPGVGTTVTLTGAVAGVRQGGHP